MGRALTIRNEPLVSLGVTLGIERDQMVAWERPDLIHRQFTVPVEAMRGLEYSVIQAARDEYGGAFSLEFRTGDLIDIRIDAATTPDKIRGFLAGTSTGHDVVIRVGKVELLARLGLDDSSVETRLFFFTDALCALLKRGLTAVESDLWETPTKGLRIYLMDSESALVGPWLSIVSIDRPASEPPSAGEVARAQRIGMERDRYIGWDDAFVQNLTPAQLHVSGESDNAELVDITCGQFVSLSSLYLCDRARAIVRRDGGREIRAEFRGQAHVAMIPIEDGAPLSGVDQSDLGSVAELTDWVYSADPATGNDWIADRLPFVQTRVAQLLEGRPESGRLKAFTDSARYLVEGLEWQWKAFIENRISAYLENRKELEGLVGDTVVDFRERASELVKNLSDSILAAVAVMVGTFIAAAFDKPFNEDLFRIGMIAYAAYVLIFPGILGVASSAARFRSARADFDHRMTSFRRLLGDEADDAVGGRVEQAGNGYLMWGVTVSVLYAVVTVAAFVAADRIPDLVS